MIDQKSNANARHHFAAKEDFVETRRPLSQARHLPGFVYHAPEVFDEEKERIFMVDWLCMGRVEEFPNPGDYKTFDVMGDPIVITRGKNGELNAFSNMCCHRGVEVAQGEGNRKAFVCPYHAWSYDLEGKLISASHMKENENFDPKACRMPPLLLDIWEGWIFVNFDMEASSLITHLGLFVTDFEFLRMGDLKLGAKCEIELPCNWKLVSENIVDYYHMRTIHRNTNGRFITDEASSFTLRENGGYVWEYDAGPSTTTGQPVFGPIPWLDDRPERFSISGFLRPSMTLFSRIDTVSPGVVWPIAPDRSKYVKYYLFPEEALSDPDFEIKVQDYVETTKRTLAEDQEMVISLQRAMSTRRFSPGYMAKPETGVHHIINYYVDRMFENS